MLIQKVERIEVVVSAKVKVRNTATNSNLEIRDLFDSIRPNVY